MTRNDARYLGGALLTWAVGMYVFMELAPALLIVPAAWALYRPTVRIVPVAVATVVAIGLWSPYLRFESNRHFADVRSQLLVQPLAPGSYEQALCEPAQRVRLWQGSTNAVVAVHENPQSGIAMRAGRRLLAIVDGLVINFQSVIPTLSVVLCVLTLAGLLIASGRDVALAGRWWTWLGVMLAAGALLANELVLRLVAGDAVWWRSEVIASLRTAEILAAITAASLLARRRLALLVDHARTMTMPCGDPRVLGIALAVPWAVSCSHPNGGVRIG